MHKALKTLVCSLVLSVISLTCAANAGAQDVVLRPGDVIRFFVWGDSIMTGDFPVDERGIVILPYVGEVELDGVPVAGLREALRSRLSGDLRRTDNIQITPLRRLVVMGDVYRPGVLLVDPTTTLAEVLALAGGTTPDADPGKVRIIRSGGVSEITVTPSTPLANTGVLSGDQVFIPKRSWANRNMSMLISTGISTTMSLIFLLVSII